MPVQSQKMMEQSTDDEYEEDCPWQNYGWKERKATVEDTKVKLLAATWGRPGNAANARAKCPACTASFTGDGRTASILERVEAQREHMKAHCRGFVNKDPGDPHAQVYNALTFLVSHS